MTNTESARAAGLTSLNQVRVVEILAAGPATMSEISRALGISTAAVTGIADKLMDLGFAQRVHGSEDRRSVWLKLTPAGQLFATATAAA